MPLHPTDSLFGPCRRAMLPILPPTAILEASTRSLHHSRALSRAIFLCCLHGVAAICTTGLSQLQNGDFVGGEKKEELTARRKRSRGQASKDEKEALSGRRLKL